MKERSRWAEIDVLSLWFNWLENTFINSLHTIGVYI